MNINQKVRTQTRRMNIDIFFESNFVGVNRLLILVYSNVVDNSKKYKATRYYLANGVIKRYEDIRKLKAGPGEDCTTAGC